MRISARLVGVALAAVVAGDLAAVALTAAPAPVPAVAQPAPVPAPVTSVRAVDVVAPTPVTVVFPTPTAARRPRVVAAARTRTLPAPSCGTPEQRGAAALASLLHPVPTGVSISYLDGRSDVLGLTYLSQRHVDVFVRSCDRESSALLRHVVAHELGHAYDASRMTADLRAQYLAARGIPAGTPWLGCDRCADFATPAGDFAETYALWMRGGGDSRSRLAPAPSSAALAALAARFFSHP